MSGAESSGPSEGRCSRICPWNPSTVRPGTCCASPNTRLKRDSDGTSPGLSHPQSLRDRGSARSIRTSSFVSLTFSTALRRNALKIFSRLAGGRPFPFHFA